MSLPEKPGESFSMKQSRSELQSIVKTLIENEIDYGLMRRIVDALDYGDIILPPRIDDFEGTALHQIVMNNPSSIGQLSEGNWEFIVKYLQEFMINWNPLGHPSIKVF